ncbi:MAG: glycerophosphodiester phosphodiesterase [Desulfobacterales bacterium]|jgi:glycerophosphoryl diester phosphodiesterase
MTRWFSTLLALPLAVVPLSDVPLAAQEKIVIAHRGASGYLPEHSQAGKAMAYAMGADFIEQDLVLTRDGRLVVLHDLYLDQVSDVARVFPDRHRKDGHYYVIDFTLDEIRQLALTERRQIEGGRPVPRFADRFPPGKSLFRVSTMEEEIELIQGLNRSTGQKVGIYPEIKSPAFHHHEGRDIGRAVLGVLKAYGYTKRDDRIYLQCFDPRELKRIREELLPEMGMDLKLVQLIAKTQWQTTLVYANGRTTPYDYDWMQAPGAMAKIAAYADGIGPWMGMLVAKQTTRDKLVFSGMVQEAHAAGLVIHPYTFRVEKSSIPAFAADFDDLLDIFLFKAGVEGVFTDFPDRVVAFLRRRQGA